MMHHPIFETFTPATSVASGRHVYDFLGTSTDVSYKKGWAQHAPRQGAEITPSYPPLNEHYFDWIATLQSVRAAAGCFRMAELGAGWAPWLVRAALAARQCSSINDIELVAVEADETHFGWVGAHFRENGLSSPSYHLIRGAIAAQRGTLRFPKIENPDEDYGASTRAVTATSNYVDVVAYTVEDVLNKFSGPVNFMHVDIQGAEYDALPPAMAMLTARVKNIMVGTHISTERHNALAQNFTDNGWIALMNFGRGELCQTPFGDVTFGDGFLYFRNPRL
jgi:FkbM family methyltransferase